MTQPKSNRQPAFFWQGMLILLPVVVFAVLGVIFLQKDRTAVQEEAHKTAEILARQIADYVSNDLHHRMESQYLDALQARELNPALGTTMAIVENAHDNSRGGEFKVPMPEYRRLLASLPSYRHGQLGFPGFFPALLVNLSGNLVQPPPYPEIPVPQPLDESPLSESQRQLWQVAHQTTGPGRH